MSEFVMVRLPRDLSARVDRARGDVPRERWVRRALEQALGAKPGGQSVSTAQGGSSEIRPDGVGSIPAERVGKAGVRDAAPVAAPAPARAPRVVSEQQLQALERQRRLNEGKG